MYKINRVRLDCRELTEISQQNRFTRLKDFALKIHSMFGSTYVCETTFSTMKQIIPKKQKSNGRRNTGP